MKLTVLHTLLLADRLAPFMGECELLGGDVCTIRAAPMLGKDISTALKKIEITQAWHESSPFGTHCQDENQKQLEKCVVCHLPERRKFWHR